MEGAQEAARDEAGLWRGGGERGEAVRIERGRLVPAVGLVAVVRCLSRGDPGEPGAEGVGGSRGRGGAEAAGAHLRQAPRTVSCAAGAEGAADEGGLIEDRGVVQVDGGIRGGRPAAARPWPERAWSAGADAAAGGRIDLLAQFRA
ncbi:hypothetical protein BE20_06500 [Sorangium cellulosum]|nr:hypothetical protein BE20_06500 [Sorangium cellulosum]